MAAASGGGGGACPQSSSVLSCPPLRIRITPGINKFSSSSSTPLTHSSSSAAAPLLPPSSSTRRAPMVAEGWMTSSSSEEERQAARVERLWQQFFSDPSKWWDKRCDKGNPETPDFKHKSTKQRLWINDRFSPSWLQAKLATLNPKSSQQPSSSPSSCSSSSIECRQEAEVFDTTTCQESRITQLWEDFFSDPSQWRDHRSGKACRSFQRNRRFPDFKHKTTKTPLWIDNRFNPPWVHGKLAAMKQCQEQGQSGSSIPVKSGHVGRIVRMEQLWQEFFSVPSEWWDNRFIKKSPNHPDFTHKGTHEGLWIDGWLNPPWVKTKMATMALGQLQPGGGVKSGLHDYLCKGDNVSKLCGEGRLKEALHMVELTVQQNSRAPINAYVGLLKGCAKWKALGEGKRVHALIVLSGLDSDIFLGKTLVDMYAKCGSVLDARKVFNAMPEHDVFSWTAIISAYADHGQGEEAITLFQQMQQTGIAPDKVAFAVVLKACARIAALEHGKQFHSDIIEHGFESDVVIGNTLVDMYAKCGCIDHARLVFNKMSERDVVSWSAMIAGYSQNGLGKEALALYEQMKQESVPPNNVTYAIILKVCARIVDLEQGRQLHSDIIKSGFESDVIVGNTLVDMYVKCGCIDHASQVFNKMSERDVVSWSTMIAGYAHTGLGKEALALYEQMKQEGVQPDDVTYVLLLKAFASIAALEQGKQLHSQIIKSGFESNVIVGSALVHMYVKCGSMEHAYLVFNKMHKRGVVSWTEMISGYAQQGLDKEALALYEQMKQERVQPDVVTYVVLLKACARIADLEMGKQLHSNIIKSDFESDMIVGSALIDMYAKCGCIEHAWQVFNNMHDRDVVSWTAMIAGYARQGLGKEALTLLEQMQREGMKLDGVTYVTVLSACSHSGLVDEGRHLFDSMCKDNGFMPTMDHYACMVDLLCRAGCLADAEDFINKMPIQPNAVVWRTLLSAARNHGYADIGRRAFDFVLKLEPENAAAHVLLSNTYAAAGLTDMR